MRRLSLAAAIVALSALAVRAEDAMGPEVVAAIKAATVFVKVKAGELSGSGSGFLVATDDGNAYVVTNHHVVEPTAEVMVVVPERRPGMPRAAPRGRDALPAPAPRATPPGHAPRVVTRSSNSASVTVVFRSGTKQEQSLRAEILAVDPRQDLAVLKVGKVREPPAPIDCLHEPKLLETMPVYTFGFPFGDILATGKANPAITVGKGSVSSLRLDDHGELAVVQIDGALNPGNSGGPVVDAQGRLVGVAVATIRNASGIGLAIPARELARMLEGRPGPVHLHASRDDSGQTTVRVEVGLIDPLKKITSVALHYLAADAVKAKPKPNDRLEALPGCRKLPLKLENQLATGEFRLRSGVGEASLLCQAVCSYAAGQQRFSASVRETVGSEVARVAPRPDMSNEIPAPAPAAGPLAVPSAAEIAEAKKVVKELHGDEYAAAKPAARAALAAKLLKQAGETKDDPAGRYVLLCEARDVAAQAGDPGTASQAAEQLAAEYAVAPGAARAPLAALAAASLTADAARAAADVLVTAADAAAAGDDWEAAEALAKAAETAARKSRNPAVMSLAKARHARIEKLKVEAAKVQEHFATLKENPDDRAANLAVGRFLCLVKRDWEAAIPHLAKGATGPLKAAVDKDLQAAQGDDAAQIAAADAWYELAADVGPDATASLQLRAYHWYLLAIPNASGLNKAKAEKRVQELQAAAEGASDNSKLWLHVRKALADQRVKRWPIVGGAFAQKTFEETPQGGAILIGFRYTTASGGRYPGAVQPIFRTATGEVFGRIYGVAEPTSVPQIVKARPGYAVGAIYVRGGGGFDAFRPIFMRIKNNGLDIADRYDGPHVGGQGGGAGTLGGDGNLIVGLHGKVNDAGKMEAMSPVSLATQPAATDGPAPPWPR